MKTTLWSAGDILVMRQMVKDGCDDEQISKQLKRSTQAVQKKRLKILMTRYPAREINDQPWEPLPGMAKRRCEQCCFWFATPQDKQSAFCPECR